MKPDIKSDFKIRDYKPEDFTQIDQLWQLTDLGGKQRGDDEIVIQRTIDMGGKLLVLIDRKAKEIIGTSWMTHDFRRIYLHHFGIHPNYQRKGLGEYLAKESLLFAKKQKMQIKLEVHKDNIGAIKLYEKISFSYLGDYLVYIIRNINSIE